MESAINIILDEGIEHKPQVLFVEIELDNGRGIGIGTRSMLPNGLTRLRITALDIMQAEADPDNEELPF